MLEQLWPTLFPVHQKNPQTSENIHLIDPSLTHLFPSHHALSLSRRCGILSRISVSRSLANSTLLARLRLLARSIFALLLLAGGLSSTGNVDRGENVSLRLLRGEVGLFNPPTLEFEKSADMGRGARRLLLVELVAGGFLT